MAYESYKITANSYISPQDEYIKDKKAQIRYLFDIAMDRVSDCMLNGTAFTENPRIFDRKIKTNYFQTAILETINENDYFNSGNLILYDSDNWLCTSAFVFHDLYCKGNLQRCNYTIKWQDKDTLAIKEYPAFVQSASQYNSGEEGNKTITIGYNQYMIVLPSNSDTIKLDRHYRFFIDKPNGTNIVYRLTRNDVVPYSDWDDGCVCWIVTEDQYNPETDRIDLMLCDYITPTPTPPIPPDITITYSGQPQIYNGGTNKTFTAVSINEITLWSKTCTEEQNDYIILTPDPDDDKKCKVKCLANEALFGTNFTLSATDGTSTATLNITIVG